MPTAYLSIGTNLGSKEKNITSAVTKLKIAGEILCESKLYESPAWGFHSLNSFLNNAVCLQTALDPFKLLHEIKLIETNMGRLPRLNETYEDRIIDIDILLYDNIIMNTPDLTIPHPLMHKRPFVLIPLSEIAPNILHPLLNKTIRELSDNMLA